MGLKRVLYWEDEFTEYVWGLLVLRDKFVDMFKGKNAFWYVYNLEKESERVREAAKAGDTATIEAILQKAHDTETGMTG